MAPSSSLARLIDIMVAGIGNVLRHDYEHIAFDVSWHVAQDDLPTLERVCREELAAEQAREP